MNKKFATTPARLGIGLSLAGLMAVAQPRPGNAQPRPATPVPRLTLARALRLARRHSPQLLAAATAMGVAKQAQYQAHVAFLPTVGVTSQYLYTQGDGRSFPRFIANNGVHEYVTEGDVHEDLFTGGRRRSLYGQAQARTALARAEQQLARRGLRVTVTQMFYGLAAADRQYRAAGQADRAAQKFLAITRALQKGGQVAQSDVLQAELQYERSQVATRNAKLAARQARMNLAVLLFVNWRQPFTLSLHFRHAPVLPPLSLARARALARNPVLDAARANLRGAQAAVGVASSGYWPTLSLDYYYGIDATHFATRTNGLPNLGSSALASLTIPLWNWGATHSQVRAAQLRRHQARYDLRYTQAQLHMLLASDYAAARAAWHDLHGLRRARTQARQGLRLILLRYRAGDSTALEVVTAQQNLMQARTQLAQAEASYRVAFAQLETLTGVLP